ncbi:MAG: EVE domain-containing protein [Coriobacteriia bacterium]|nr:EVE domain-containing protein [Coriobacteriia bacterium]
MPRQYWVDLFTGKTWDEFVAAGARTSGFRESKAKSVRRLKRGDWLLCYVTGVSRFIAILEVEGEPFTDDSRIWSDDVFPVRIAVKPVVQLTPETAVPVSTLLPRLSFYDETRPNAWTGRFRSSPSLLRVADGETIADAILRAKDSPQEYPVDRRKWNRVPRGYESGDVVVTIPEDEAEPVQPELELETGGHERVQNLLLRMGASMGFDLWVARNDKGRADTDNLGGRLRDSLPRQFDDATSRTIEHIDVLWLKGNSIEAAFEIEHTTSIYSGLLRMADLVAMQPNLSIRLYLVAPDDKRDKVLQEIARPAFARLPRPLSEICRYIAYSSLEDAAKKYAPVLSHLKPDFLDEIAEAAEPR